jgi:hypothetical protein
MRIPIRLKLASATLLAALGFASSAYAETETPPAPVWNVRAIVAPANLPPGGEGVVIVTATNLGDVAASASGADPIRISAKLPVGVTATSIASDNQATSEAQHRGPSTCEEPTLSSGTCEATSGKVLIYEPVEIVIHVHVKPNAHSGPVEMSASGGGAATVSTSDPLTVSEAPVKFGLERFEMQPFNEDGSLDTQAGSHPFQFTTTLAYNEAATEQSTFADDAHGAELVEELVPEPLAFPKDLTFDLPPGLIGDPSAVPQCPLREFEAANGDNRCPPDTQVGVVTSFVSGFGVELEGQFGYPFSAVSPVYNLEPSVGEPARFGFVVKSDGTVAIFLDTSVRTGGNYGVVVSVSNISQQFSFVGSQLSFWGDPADPRHDRARGEGCLFSNEFGVSGCTEAGASKQAPFLSLPASCSGLSNPFTASMETTSWVEPASPVPDKYVLQNTAGEPLGMTGCNRLPFNPSITVAPDSEDGSTPTGLTVGVHVDQTAALNPTGLTEADVKNTTVALPQGVQLSPSAADGLQACSLSQIGFTGVSPETGADEFTPSAPSCPDASKVATVSIKTPLLPNELKGAVYLAAPQNFAGLPQNPFSSLVAMYLVAEDPVSGVLVKLPGKVTPNPETGQLVSTFEDTPQLPFEDLELHFFGSARAPLATPALCGTYTTQASFMPSTETPPAESASSFDIDSGPNGAPCSDPLPFAPSLVSDTTNIQAGAFSDLETTLGREDGQQNIQNVVLHYPPGLSGILSGVKLCPEAQANAGTCGLESEIGETIVSVGLGNDPFTVTGGKVYITGPYEGAPFGLSIVNPAAAGPFVLQEGHPVVVRAKIEVDPHTAALTITTNSSGPYAIPHIIEGIPLNIKHVNVNVNRPGFTFNPTNCTPAAITGSVASDEGASSPVSVPFQVTNCAGLKFAPKFAVSTSGKTSKANGASLVTKLSYPNGSQGAEANIHEVKVELPKQLPSRLTTLQKACTNAQFEANPAGCPSASVIGHAIVHTQLLPVPLEGPAIFVSHGGEAFPSLTMVLQGYGVTIDLVGTTFISKAGVTSTTFKAAPDQPFSTFELTLPEGKFSALTALGDLCTEKLTMPTELVAQNGAVIHQSTKIGVTGCAKKKSLTRAQKLAAALKVCHKDHKQAKRERCEREAHKKYGSPKKKVKAKRKG